MHRTFDIYAGKTSLWPEYFRFWACIGAAIIKEDHSEQAVHRLCSCKSIQVSNMAATLFLFFPLVHTHRQRFSDLTANTNNKLFSDILSARVH